MAKDQVRRRTTSPFPPAEDVRLPGHPALLEPVPFGTHGVDIGQQCFGRQRVSPGPLGLKDLLPLKAIWQFRWPPTGGVNWGNSNSRDITGVSPQDHSPYNDGQPRRTLGSNHAQSRRSH
jgi:hypothetical protein